MYNWLKIGAFIVAGRFLKPRIKGLLLLLVFWIAVRFVHAEYISYVELSGDTRYLVHAALAKIILYLLAFLVYLFTVERKILRRTEQEIEAQRRHENTFNRDDGFDFLRRKKKLESPTDRLLKKN